MMRAEKSYNVIEEVRKVRNRMSLKHWNNPDLFKMKLDAAAKRLQEQLSHAHP
jgi:hypothetical protein